MNRMWFVAPVTMVLAGCGSDLDLVKGGVMEFNKTITLGQALDNWKSCEQRSWEEFKADNGVRVVQFSCQHAISQYVEKLKSLLSAEAQESASHLNIASNVQTFQFTINQDGSFQIDNVQVKTTWADGTSFEDPQEPVEQLQIAYSNKFNFDENLLNAITAGQLSYVFSIIKARAN